MMHVDSPATIDEQINDVQAGLELGQQTLRQPSELSEVFRKLICGAGKNDDDTTKNEVAKRRSES